MTDDLERVLQLVAEGRLTAAQAAPILDALDEGEQAVRAAERAADDAAGFEPSTRPGTHQGTASVIRIEITEAGRRVVNLRIPVLLGRMALDRIPGLSGSNIDLVRQALADGRSGTLLDIDDDGDGVRIVLE
jgi:hypothetical protein